MKDERQGGIANTMLAVRAKVYYAFDVIGKMGRSKPAMTVIYENENWIPERSYKTLNNAYTSFHKRWQTKYEFSCAEKVGRAFSLYTYFFKDFKTIEDLVEQVITDDKYLCDNNIEAGKFRMAFYKKIDSYGHNKKRDKRQLELSV